MSVNIRDLANDLAKLSQEIQIVVSGINVLVNDLNKVFPRIQQCLVELDQLRTKIRELEQQKQKKEEKGKTNSPQQ